MNLISQDGENNMPWPFTWYDTVVCFIAALVLRYLIKDNYTYLFVSMAFGGVYGFLKALLGINEKQ